MPKWECDECGHENHIPKAVMKACAEVKKHCEECGKEQWFDFSGYSGDNSDKPSEFGAAAANINLNNRQTKNENNLINRNNNRNLIGNGL